MLEEINLFVRISVRMFGARRTAS